MKLEEKIIKLRKRNAWSQEELAEKLDVTRQTVSKWELGQTTPDADKLTKMATIFNVTANDLLDENTEPAEKESKVNNNGRPTKIIIIVIILIFVILGIGAITINKVLNKFEKVSNQIVPNSIVELFEQYSFSDIFGMIFGKFQETEKEYNVDSFNSKFKTLYYGSTDGFFMNNFLDTVIKSNEENPEHIITVNFADTETNDASELRKMKKKFSKGTTYEIIYEYDENGLINKAIIEKQGGINMDTIILMTLVVIAILVILIIKEYNKIIKLQNKVKSSESGIDIYLNQRFDLIPNLVECVKGYAKHEKQLLENITKQRTEYAKNQNLKKAGELNKSLNKVIAIAENYPELKASEQFISLQNNLVKMESQLQAARRIYNTDVQRYNSAIQTVPSNIVAGIFGFKEKEFFQIEEYKKENIKIDGENM